ncbi:GTP-binding protein [Cohnella sp. REN36]|nr:GTP-binding protein [Cohnella sp. REN36]MCC3373703.1 GTP-binding protein [Cohnella sp. REN36]
MKKVPIVILSGFLGSGKTTLLAQMLDYYTTKGVRPAVIMNEVGDVNLDGQLVNETIPMREMLSGCICCTIRGDLGMEIGQLINESSPDLIIIEATGVANPMDIFDAVTEAALHVHIDIHAMITVVDAGQFLQRHRRGKSKTYRLLEDQIRCSSLLLLNKSDLMNTSELNETKRILETVNSKASIHTTVHCEIDDALFNRMLQEQERISFEDANQDEQGQHSACNHHHHEDEHSHDRNHPKHHHSYDHVMVYTHYFQQPMDSSRFEQIISELPDGVYRAKGIFTAAETGERMMFQFAYRQLEILRIQPQGRVQDVAVFMGEQFPKHELKRKLEQSVLI